MALWSVTYRVSGTVWSAVAGDFNSITDEFSGRQEAIFSMPNNSANRAFCGTYQDIRISFAGSQIFEGKLMARSLTAGKIRAICYNPDYEWLKKSPLPTNVGWLVVGAGTLVSYVCSLTGQTKGLCPTTSISINSLSLGMPLWDVLDVVRSHLDMDLWAQSGTVNIGTKGVLLGGTLTEAGLFDERVIDDAKKCTSVLILNGAMIGSYGSGNNGTKVFFDSSTDDQTSLNLLAQKKYNEVNKEGGLVFSIPIMQSFNVNSGDKVTIGVPELLLSGVYQVNKITKYATKSKFEVNET